MLDLPIDYLAYLSYIDLRNLCQTNKEMTIYCQTNKLREIISFRSKILLLPNANIAKLLRDLDDSLINLIEDNYSDLPRWVNRELFMIDFRKDLYSDLIDQLSYKLEDYYTHDTKKFLDGLIENNGTIKIELNKDNMSFALTSRKYKEEHSYGGDLDINDIIFILPKDLVDYIVYGLVNNSKDYDYHGIYRLLEKLLFI